MQVIVPLSPPDDAGAALEVLSALLELLPEPVELLHETITSKNRNGRKIIFFIFIDLIIV